MRYSIVVPIYNEEESVTPLYRELKNVMEGLKEDYEILFVNDGSTDKTLANLIKLKKKEKKLTVIDFPRNFGKSAALRAGFDQAQGDIVITLDADLQDDPKNIPSLLSKIKHYDVVSSWRVRRKDNISKIFVSRVGNWLQRRFTGLTIHDINCCLKAYKKETLEDLALYGELHRYIPVLLAQKGYTIGEVKVSHHPRKYGKTKYGIMRLLRGLLDLIDVKFWSSFEARPLHLFGSIGLVLSSAGIALGIVLAVLRLLRIKYLSNSVLPLFSIGLVLVGLQFLILGLLASMIVRRYYSDKNRKPYRIRKIL